MVYIYRATDHNTYEINKPRCEKKRCNISLDDCSNAMLALPVNQKGNLIGTEPGYYSANATRGNCTVKVITTDYALLRLTHQEADASFRVLVNECKDHPGDIFINGGTAGYNGDVRISIRGFGNHTCSWIFPSRIVLRNPGVFFSQNIFTDGLMMEDIHLWCHQENAPQLEVGSVGYLKSQSNFSKIT